MERRDLDARLLTLINAYQAATRAAIELMIQSGIALPSSHRAWALARLPHTEALAGGIRMRKHGFGCEVFLPGGSVDFDFGANGEYDGVDAWRLKSFAKGRLADFGLSSEQEVDGLFARAVQSGALVPSGSVLYHLRHRVSTIGR